MIADLIRENEIAWLPHCARSKTLFRLIYLVPLQLLHNKGSNGDDTAPAVFNADQLIWDHIFFLVELHLLIDGDGVALKVYTTPSQAQHFALPQPGEQGHNKDDLEFIAFNGFQKCGNLHLVKGMDFLFYDFRQLAEIPVCRIQGDVTIDDCLPERTVQDAVDILDGFGGERRKVIYGFAILLDSHSMLVPLRDLLPPRRQSVQKFLNSVSVQLIQADCGEIGLDMQSDIVLVNFDGTGLDAAQIGVSPDVQPLAQGHFAWLSICLIVHRRHGLSQLLPDFLLRFGVDGLADRLSRPRIVAHNEACLPCPVRPLPDGPRAGGGTRVALSWH